MILSHPQQEHLNDFLRGLRAQLIDAFEKLESQARFIRTPWKYHHEGGGEIALLRGDVFEKAAVNWSAVGGPSYPLSDRNGPFLARGISLITHMANPHAPTVHLNLRFIQTDCKCWFGGGYDLSPMGITYPEDTEHFHSVARKALEPFGSEIYDNFAQTAKEYFYIPHRSKERGVGGVFFDHLDSGDFDKDMALWQAVGNSFIHAILPIYHKRIAQPYIEEERQVQLRFRAHYAEFNLMYDRGTRFGFQSGGNPEAILCSMPPLVQW